MSSQRLEDVLRDVNKKFKSDVCKQGMSFDAVKKNSVQLAQDELHDLWRYARRQNH